jgi:hypothetical protein
MAKSPSTPAKRTREDGTPEPEVWEAPTSDQEFVFESVDAAPNWIDKGWASFSQGPALALPAGDLYGTGPYHTKIARVGDTVMFKAATPSKPAHFEVVEGEPVGDAATKKPPQASAASLEDMLKTGVMTPEDLGPDAKAQVSARTPQLSKLIEEGANAPEAIPVSDLVKTE